MPPRPRVPHRERVPEGAVDDDPSRAFRRADARSARLTTPAGAAWASPGTSAVAADNAAMTGLLRNLGTDVASREFGTLEYEMALACVPVRRARFRGNAPGRVELS
jgi:hypothetical protein